MAKLKAATLVESIVAMVIISIVFSAGLMVVEMVINSNRSAFRYRVNLALQEMANETKLQNRYIDEQIDSADYRVVKQILPYQNRQHIFVLSLTAFDLDNERVMGHRELVFLP